MKNVRMDALMTTITIQRFTDAEEELAHVLMDAGMQKPLSLVLVFLQAVPEATSREIERGTDLHQPQVSMALSELFSRRWITSRPVSFDRKTRRSFVYSLALPFREIVDRITDEIEAEVEGTAARIARVREGM